MSQSRVPAPTGEYKFELPVQLRFNDVDMFGHVNNTVYLEFFDLAKLRYFEAALGTDFAHSGFAVVVVNINCNFYSPAFLGDELVVLTRTETIGDKSLTLDQRIIDRRSGDVKCVCRTIMAGFDAATLTSAPIPDRHRAAINDFEK